MFSVFVFFLLLLSSTPAPTLPFPSCPHSQQGGTPGTGHCFVPGAEVSMRWWLLLQRCAGMCTPGTAASHKPGTQLSLKENPCSGFTLVQLRQEGTNKQEQCHPFSPAGEAPSDVSFPSFTLATTASNTDCIHLGKRQNEDHLFG